MNTRQHHTFRHHDHYHPPVAGSQDIRPSLNTFTNDEISGNVYENIFRPQQNIADQHQPRYRYASLFPFVAEHTPFIGTIPNPIWSSTEHEQREPPRDGVVSSPLREAAPLYGVAPSYGSILQTGASQTIRPTVGFQANPPATVQSSRIQWADGGLDKDSDKELDCRGISGSSNATSHQGKSYSNSSLSSKSSFASGTKSAASTCLSADGSAYTRTFTSSECENDDDYHSEDDETPAQILAKYRPCPSCRFNNPSGGSHTSMPCMEATAISPVDEVLANFGCTSQTPSPVPGRCSDPSLKKVCEFLNYVERICDESEDSSPDISKKEPAPHVKLRKNKPRLYPCRPVFRLLHLIVIGISLVYLLDARDGLSRRIVTTSPESFDDMGSKESKESPEVITKAAQIHATIDFREIMSTLPDLAEDDSAGPKKDLSLRQAKYFQNWSIVPKQQGSRHKENMAPHLWEKDEEQSTTAQSTLDLHKDANERRNHSKDLSKETTTQNSDHRGEKITLNFKTHGFPQINKDVTRNVFAITHAGLGSSKDDETKNETKSYPREEHVKSTDIDDYKHELNIYDSTKSLVVGQHRKRDFTATGSESESPGKNHESESIDHFQPTTPSAILLFGMKTRKTATSNGKGSTPSHFPWNMQVFHTTNHHKQKQTTTYSFTPSSDSKQEPDDSFTSFPLTRETKGRREPTAPTPMPHSVESTTSSIRTAMAKMLHPLPHVSNFTSKHYKPTKYNTNSSAAHEGKNATVSGEISFNHDPNTSTSKIHQMISTTKPKLNSSPSSTLLDRRKKRITSKPKLLHKFQKKKQLIQSGAKREKAASHSQISPQMEQISLTTPSNHLSETKPGITTYKTSSHRKSHQYYDGLLTSVDQIVFDGEAESRAEAHMNKSAPDLNEQSAFDRFLYSHSPPPKMSDVLSKRYHPKLYQNTNESSFQTKWLSNEDQHLSTQSDSLDKFQIQQTQDRSELKSRQEVSTTFPPNMKDVNNVLPRLVADSETKFLVYAFLNFVFFTLIGYAALFIWDMGSIVAGCPLFVIPYIFIGIIWFFICAIVLLVAGLQYWRLAAVLSALVILLLTEAIFWIARLLMNRAECNQLSYFCPEKLKAARDSCD